jgi:hypothetical protein
VRVHGAIGPLQRRHPFRPLLLRRRLRARRRPHRLDKVSIESRGARRMRNHGRRASDDRKFGIPRRAIASRPAPKRIYRPRRGLNDISVLSKSCRGRSLSHYRAVIWRMSAKIADSFKGGARL